MNTGTALAAFVLAAGLLTLTPGLDTVLVIRSRLAGGATAGLAAAVGVALGCLVWGGAAAVGLGAVLEAAPRAFVLLRWCGAFYLLGCGVLMLLRPRTSLVLNGATKASAGRDSAVLRGLLTNLLNPKVGLFYLSFLPQFVPAGVHAGWFMALLTAIHAGMGLAWLSALVAGMGVLRRFVLRDSVLPWLDRAAGCVFVGFGLKLAFDRG